MPALKFARGVPVTGYSTDLSAKPRQAAHRAGRRLTMPTNLPVPFGARCAAAMRRLCDLAAVERDALVDQMSRVRGLLPLLMKQRNGNPWTSEDKAELRAHLRRLQSLFPYLLLVALPGSFLALPLLAWWLDRRRQRRAVRAEAMPVAAQEVPPRTGR
ncbi:MAG: hypothetical protein JNM90_13450 [Burkholderiales bacterium]|nr:hypothetical protein [Burkholderiales bacterium]